MIHALTEVTKWQKRLELLIMLIFQIPIQFHTTLGDIKTFSVLGWYSVRFVFMCVQCTPIVDCRSPIIRSHQTCTEMHILQNTKSCFYWHKIYWSFKLIGARVMSTVWMLLEELYQPRFTMILSLLVFAYSKEDCFLLSILWSFDSICYEKKLCMFA